VKPPAAALCLLGLQSLLCACVTRQADHYYVLNPLPQDMNAAPTAASTQVTLRVTLPSLVDRPEMIVNTSTDGIIVLEHERWAAPLGDLVTQTLARDIERRRNDILVTGNGVYRSSDAGIKIMVDVVQMTVHRGQQASIEAHWRIIQARTGKEQVAGEVFSAGLGQDGYSAIAQALSACLGLLADRLVAQLQ
jgi:uncharacterized protein